MPIPGIPDLSTIWTRRGLPALALLPLASLYSALAALHRATYRWGWRQAERVSVPVIVVGNVIAGGAGKTPVVLALVRHLLEQGMRPGVISRGYGRASHGLREVSPASNPQEVGDEPLLIAQRAGVPVFVSERRAEAARALLEAHPEVQVLICDDGLQHLALARDIEICVFDERGVGNAWPIPAGPLREPWPRPLDFVLHPEGLAPDVSHPDPAGRTRSFVVGRRLAQQAVSADGSQVPLTTLAGQSPLALAGIARPQAFFDMLVQSGCPPAVTLPLPDHHDFQFGADVPPGGCLICTEKDAVKLWQIRPDAWAVPLELSITEDFWVAIDTRLRPKLSSSDGSQTD